MNQRYQNNAAFLSRFFPSLSQRLENKAIAPLGLPLTFLDAENGSRTAVLEGRYLHSRHDPVVEAQRWARGNPPHEQSIVIFLGWGLGYHVVEWMKIHGHRVSTVIVIEPEVRLFLESMRWVDFSALAKTRRMDIVLGLYAEDLYQSLHRCLDVFLTHDLQMIPLPFVEVYPDFLPVLKQQLLRIYATRESILTHMAETGARCQRHLMGNIPAMAQSLYPRDIAGIARGEAAIIIAAGPSLDNNIEQLKGWKENVWLLAVDTSLRILRQHEIEPHIVVTKDPTDLNKAHFEGLQPQDNLVLAFDPQIDPAIPPMFTGLKICMPNRNSDYTRYLPGLETTEADQLGFSTNVAIAAFNLAVKMGCSPILFIGLDLCFSGSEGKSHAEGSALRSETVFDSSAQSMRYTRGEAEDTVQAIMVEGVDGTLYPTIPNFFEAKQLLEMRICDTGVQTIDASEGGARIIGTEIMPLAEALRQFATRPVSMERLLQQPLPRRNEKKLQKKMRQNAEFIARCGSLAATALQQCEQGADLEILDGFRQQLEEGYRLYQLLHAALERTLVDMSRPGFWDRSRMEPQEIRQRYAGYFATIRTACEQCAGE
jgi:hypothetical protein